MKHAHKTLLSLALVFLMLSALTIPAAADVIIEPQNLFYATHRDECQYLRVRHYLANSDAGYVYLYQSPDNKMTVGSYPNGEKLALTWLYVAPDGSEWGLLYDESGWFCLNDLSLVYDSREFLKDNEALCQPCEPGSFESISSSNASPVLTWTYPGGERQEYDITNGDVSEFVSLTYTDGNGNVWGHINYMYGMRDFWVCLSKPYDENAGGFALADHEISLKEAPTPEEEIPVSENNKTLLIVAGVLIVAVVVGTAVLIRTSFAKKSKQ